MNELQVKYIWVAVIRYMGKKGTDFVLEDTSLSLLHVLNLF